MLLRRLVLAEFFLLLPLSLHAQARDPARFRDSLAVTTDVPGLFRLERSLEMPGAARSIGPILERGLIARRIYELSGDRADAARSRDAFDRALAKYPNEPWSHYGMALALAAGPDKAITNFGGVLTDITLVQSFAELVKKDPKSKARGEARRALELDPAFGDAAVLLSELAVADGGRSASLVREARDALSQTRAAGAAGPNVRNALARMETQLGNYGAAAQITETGVEVGDALALKERGESLMLSGRDEEGGRTYARAISLATPDAASSMYGDIQVLLTPSEAAEWKRNTSSDQQSLWLQRFWERRAAESGVTVTERIATHYRRLSLAKQKYVRSQVRGVAGGGMLLSDKPAGQYPYDERGVILVRHGAPLKIVSSQSPGALPNETWVYDIPGVGPQLFHFVALRGAHDYSLVSDLTKAIDPRAGTDQRNNALLTLLQDRVPFEPKYQTAASRLRLMFARDMAQPLDGTNIRAVLESTDADYRRGARVALRTDSYRKNYENDVAYMSDVFTFRTPLARTELTAAFAIPAKNLEAMAGSNGTRYSLRLSAIVIDTLQGIVTRRDTTVEVDAGRKLGKDEFVRTHITLPVIPSEFTKYVLVAEDVVSGNGSRSEGDRKLRDYGSSDRLLISDIVLAVPDTAGDWQRGEQRLALVLPRRFEAARPFTVFYEVYNFMPGEEYTTQINVTAVKGGVGKFIGGGSSPIDVRFDGVAAPDANRVQQEIRKVAPDLGAGRYRMTVTITGKTSHRTAVTETTFVVAD